MCSHIGKFYHPMVELCCLRLCFLFGLLPSKEQTDEHPSHGLMSPAGSARGGLTQEQEHRTLNLMAKIQRVWLRLKQKV